MYQRFGSAIKKTTCRMSQQAARGKCSTRVMLFDYVVLYLCRCMKYVENKIRNRLEPFLLRDTVMKKLLRCCKIPTIKIFLSIEIFKKLELHKATQASIGRVVLRWSLTRKLT